MQTTFKRYALLFLVLALSACGSAGEASSGEVPVDPPEVVEAQGNQLLLRSADGVLNLELVRGTRGEAPRMAEIFVKLSGPIRFSSALRGEALEKAGKQLAAQPREDGTVRLVVFASDNTERIESGVLAKLVVERTAPGEASATIEVRQPILAPREANEGLMTGDPVAL